MNEIAQVGNICIAESGSGAKKKRSIYFEEDRDTKSRVTQTSMLLAKPNALNLWYAKALMAMELFERNPLNILILGCGGGTLTKYLYHRHPQARLTTVDISEDMLTVAVDYFDTPEDSRSKLVAQDAAEFVYNANQNYDWIIADAFAGPETGYIVRQLNTPEFYTRCRHLLPDHACLSVNMLVQQNAVYGLLQQVFNPHIIRLGVGGVPVNHIAFCFKQGRTIMREDFEKRVITLTDETGLDYQRFYDDLVIGGLRQTNIRVTVP